MPDNPESTPLAKPNAQLPDVALLLPGLNSLPHAILLISHDGTITFANPSAEELCGAPLAGENLFQLSPDARHALGEQAAREAIEHSTSVFCRLSDLAPERHVTASPVQAKSEGTQHFCVVSAEIPSGTGSTEKAQFGQRTASVARLARGIAHDLNNALGGLTGYVSLLRARLPSTGKFTHLLHMIDLACNRSSEVITQLFEFAEDRTPTLVSLDLDTEINQALEVRVTEKMRDMGITLSRRFLEPLPSVQMDRSHVEKIVGNLCLLVARTIPEGGAMVVEATLLQPDGNAPSDGGRALQLRIGPAAALGTVGEQGTGQHAPTDLGPSGEAGLRLAIAEDILGAYNGNVVTHAGPDGSTIVIASLPLKEDAPAQVAATEGSQERLILVVDDEQIIRRMLEDSLELLGYNGIFCASGEEGLDVFKQHESQIDLAIIDLYLPGIKGNEVLTELRRIRPDLKAILTTAHVFDKVESSLSEQLSSEELLLKPFRLADLQNRLERLLDQ